MIYSSFLDVERVKTKFTDDWLNKILEIYRHCEKKRQLPPDQKKDSFMRSLAVQMTLSIQNLTLASMKDFDIFISGLNNPDKLSTRYVCLSKNSKSHSFEFEFIMIFLKGLDLS